MKEENKLDEYLFFVVLLSSLMIIALLVINTHQHNHVKELKNDLINVNEARIKAENKPCCQVIQERYIDRRLSEDGLSFIYEEHPQLIECN